MYCLQSAKPQENQTEKSWRSGIWLFLRKKQISFMTVQDFPLLQGSIQKLKSNLPVEQVALKILLALGKC